MEEARTYRAPGVRSAVRLPELTGFGRGMSSPGIMMARLVWCMIGERTVLSRPAEWALITTCGAGSTIGGLDV